VKVRTLLVVSAIALGLGLAALAVPSTGQAPVTIRYSLYSPPAMPTVIDLVAMERGYFAQEGIKIEPVTVQNGPQVIQLLESGDLQAGSAAIVPFVIGASRGVDYKLVISSAKGNAPLVVDRGITSIKDLDGKAIATPGAGTIQNSHLLYFAKQHGLKFRPVYGQGMASVLALFEKREVVGFVGWEPFAAVGALTMNGKYLVDFIRPEAMESVEFALSTKFMQANPKAALGFVRGLVKGMRYLEGRPEEADEFLAKILKVSPETVKLARQHILLTQPRFDVQGARVMLDELLADGRVKGVTDRDRFLKNLVDESLLTRAMAELDREGWKP
jgi:NitT/TauT family transport system substrate-binding protein